jgi:hypothetical protein
MECSMDRDQQSTSDNRDISSLFSVVVVVYRHEELSIVPHYCGIGNIRDIFFKSHLFNTVAYIC